MGAAYATLIAYALSAFVMYFIVQKFYRIEYEFGRIVKLALSVALVYFLEIGIVHYGFASISLRIGLICLWPVVLFLFRFFNAGELSRITGFFSENSRTIG
jgi:hypothetical protein